MNSSLPQKFIFLSLIAFLITGGLIGVSVSNHIKNDKLYNLKETTLLTLDTMFTPKMLGEDFESPLNESKTIILNETFKSLKASSNILSLRIWNKKSEEIYSTSMLTHFVSEQEIPQILKGHVQIKILKLNDAPPPDEKSNEVVQILSPITLNQKTVGYYEVLTPYEDIKSHILSLNITIIGITVSGLLILYLFLLRIIYNTSRTLVSQNESLMSQKLDLEQSYIRLDSSYKNTVMALSKAVDARDKYTAGHSQRVAIISTSIAQILKFSEEKLQLLELAALFHDIGKIGIPDEILHKKNKLTDYEFEIIKQHPSIGFTILKDIFFLEKALPIILHHHEKYIGFGYPAGIQGDAIPLEARIIAVADTYDAMTSDRPYRKGLPHDIAIKKLKKCSGSQFDPSIVSAFMRINFQSIDEIMKSSQVELG